MHENVGEIDTAVEYWKRAVNFDPIRNEALMRLCEHYLVRLDDIPSLYMYSNIGVRNKYPFPDKRVVWVEKDVYVDTGWRILDHFVVSSFHMGYYEEARDAASLLLSDNYKSILPEVHRARVQNNLDHALARMQ